ncbi:MAG: putative Ig domain-containing protein [Chryseosolibacter sp.]
MTFFKTLTRLAVIICFTIVVLLNLAFSTVVYGQLPTSFQKVELITGLKNSVNFEFAPDGRIFIVDRYGELFIYNPQTQTNVSAGVLEVFHDMEDGLLGVAFDPQFATNNFIYIHYSHPTLPRNRVSRFTMSGDQLVLTSEVVMLEWTSDRNGYFHAAGDLDFDAQGNLYIAIGDNTNHTGYAALNETDKNQSSERTSSNTDDLRGKILRVTPQPDGTYTIPSGNLFPGGVGGRPEIYVMGARNPYKIFVDKTNTNWLFWGEVGPDANVESEKGPEGMDEINLVKTAGNYGWPYLSGKNEPYLNTYANPPFYWDHANPVNVSKWNTGAANLPPARGAWLDFFHGCYLAGPRYYYNSALANPKKLPSDFNQSFFYYDFNTSKIWVVKMDANGTILSNQRFAENVITGTGFIDMKLGPDGQLYILEYGAGCCPDNVGTGKLVRVDYTGIDANKAPTVTLSADKISGPLPLTVNFSSQGTSDPDGDALTYEWDFQSDGTVDSNLPNPGFTYTTRGMFNAQLRVKDTHDAIASKTISVYPGNTAATIAFNFPPDGGMFSWEDNVNYQVQVNDQDDGSTNNGSISCSDVNVVPAFGHLTHTHDGLTLNQCNGVFFLDPTSHDAQGQDNIYYGFKVNYTDEDGLTVFDQILIYPKLMEAEFFNAQNNTKLMENTDQLGGALYSVRALSHNSYITFEKRNLQNINSVSYRLSALSGGGTIEVHADSPTGTLLSTTPIPVTGNANRWTTVTAPITNPGGRHDLYFVFKNPGAINFLDLNYVEFIGQGISTDITPPDIYSVDVLSATEVSVRFNEALDGASAVTKSNYTINNGISISSVTLEENRRTVHLITSPLGVGVENTLTIANVRNESGVAINPAIVAPFTMDETLIRINLGGPLVKINDIEWQASNYNSGGIASSKPSQSIANTTSDIIYQTELLGNFTMNVPVGGVGLYDLTLHFAELVYKNVGERIFNVSVENNQYSLVNYDMFAKAGFATALIENFDNIMVEDGHLTVIFTGVKNNAKLGALEVRYGDNASLPPSVQILNPGNGLNVVQPFDVAFKVENWWMGQGSSHVRKYVDGQYAGNLYSSTPISFTNLSVGSHKIRLVLANASGDTTAFHDQVQVNVASGAGCIDNPFPLEWEEYVIGADLPYKAPQIFAADIDRDGYKDIVTGGFWYANPHIAKGVWTRNAIGAPMNNAFLVYDFDRDGDLDVLGTNGLYLGSQLAWAANDGNGNFVVRTNIPESAGFPPGSANNNTFLAGCTVGNFNGVANIQIAITWNGSETTHAPVKMITVPADPVNNTWVVDDIAPNAVGEAIHAVDIDKDGDLDLSQAKNWLRNDNGTWTTINTGITVDTYYEHHELRDFDRDGTLEGVLTQIGDNKNIFAMEIPANPTQLWTKTPLGDDIDSGLSLDVKDLDFDGDLDLIVGEWKLEHRLIAFENDLCNSGTWIKHILHPGGTSAPDHHNGTQGADLDNDGDLDIVSVGFDKRTPRIYINNSSSSDGPNAPPTVANPILDQTAVVGTLFNFVIPGTTFVDPDGDALSYTAMLSNGNALPSWLSFFGASRTFNGTPPSGAAQTLTIRVNARDTKGGQVADEFLIQFSNIAPIVANAIPDQSAQAGQPLSFTFAVNTFTDANGDPLTYTAHLTGGAVLPAWLSFNATTRAFTGTPTLAEVGTLDIQVNASDNQVSVSDVFRYTIIDPSVNQPPTVTNQISDMAASVGVLFSFTFELNTFSDANGDSLRYSATLSNNNSLPAWLTFDGRTRTFQGTPQTPDISTIEIRLTASDGEETVSLLFRINVESGVGIRINSGGPATTAYGVPFDADKNFSGGSTYTNNNIVDIAGTTSDGIYKTERNSQFSYNVPLPAGNYRIRLHFAEIYYGASGGGNGGVGTRVFNVTGEGTPLLTNFDIFAEAGSMRALVKEFELGVTDGMLNLSFIRVVQNPKVSAIEIVSLEAPGNQPPVVANAIPDQNGVIGTTLSFTFAANTFTDADGDALTYSAQLSTGSPLPAWLNFNTGTRTFSGTPPPEAAGVLAIQVSAGDGASTVSDVFNYNITSPQNQNPVVANPIADQSGTEDQLFSFTFAANTFSDPENSPLTYSAALAGGAALPSWLTFTPSTRAFSGTPADPATLTIDVTASDGQGGSVTDSFVLTINPATTGLAIRINSGGPAMTVSGITFGADQYFTGGSTYTNNNIVDIVGTANDAIYRSERHNQFSYGVPVPSGTYNVRLHFAEVYFGATGGGAGGVGKRVFNVTGEGTPLLTNFDIFADVGAMTASIKEFQLNVTDGTLNLNFIRVLENPLVSAIEILAVSGGANQPPVVANFIPDQTGTIGEALNFAFASNTFTDADGDVLTYSAQLSTGNPLPNWLNFNAATRTFSGTPPVGADGTLAIRVSASDSESTVSDVFNYEITSPLNQNPVVANPIADQGGTVGQPYSFAFAANTFSDPDNDILTYAANLSGGNPLPAWLAFDPATRTFSGTPPAQATLNIVVNASDGNGGSVTDTFVLTIAPATPSNQQPVVSNLIPDQNGTANQSFSFAFAANTFTDPDNDILTYAATQSGGAALPAWLSFTSSTRAFGGTPVSQQTLTIVVTASDGKGGSVTDNFVLTINPASTPPGAAMRVNSGGAAATAFGVPFEADNYFTGGTAYTNTKIVDIAGTTEDVIYRSERSKQMSYQFPVPSGTYRVRLHFAELYYGATGGGIGGVGTRVFNVTGEGTPLLTNFDILAEVPSMTALVKEFQLNVTDGTLNLNFNPVVRNPKVNAIEVISLSAPANQQPVVANPIPDQNGTANQAFSFAFAANTFSDPDNDLLTYSATLSGGSSLPSWLSFSPSTRTFSGTPPAAQTLTIVVSASDGKGGSVTDNFVLTIAPASTPNQQPVVANLIPDQSGTANQSFSFAFAANTFSDPDNDVLTYSASLSGGNLLPAWLGFSSTTRTFSGTPASAQTLTIVVDASDGNGGSASDSFVLTIGPPPTQGNGIRINSGGPGFTSAGGFSFSADQFNTGGATYTNNNIADITGTTDDVLYRSERYNMSSYNFPVTSGSYLVRLHFAEIYFGATGGGTGRRIFNVAAEGASLLTNFEIAAEVGPMAALVKEFVVNVTDGVLNITFVRVTNNAKISGIEVLPNSSAARISSTEQVLLGPAEGYVSPEEDTRRSELAAYPNPLKDYTAFEYRPLRSAHVELEVIDALGAVITEVYNGPVAEGEVYSYEFDASMLRSGVYFARLREGGRTLFVKLVLTR